ncbi:MAG: ATP-binding protein [Vicinamibacterales bacterium]
MRLSLRYQLGLALIVVNVVLTAGVAVLTYRAAHDAMVDQARDAVAVVAQSRERELLDQLRHRQERLTNFLQSLQTLCGERGPNGGYGFEDECVRAAVGGVHRSERATSTTIAYRGERLYAAGGPAQVPAPAADQLVRIAAANGSGLYAMTARLGGLSAHVEFTLDEINAVVTDRAGLGTGGEAFLTDAAGFRITSASRVVAAQHPVAMEAIGPCARGASQNALDLDDRGILVIASLRHAPALGGSCIVANVSYDDATEAITRLGRLLAYSSALVVLFGGVVSVVLASVATRSLKRLAGAARRLGEGRFDTPIPAEGPSEVHQLGRTLSAMAASIGQLVQREQHARHEAEAANRTKDQFLATLSHELRTPLNAILGWASILSRSGYDPARVRHAVHVIERNARIQSQMIEELLDVSRIVSGTVRLQPTDVRIGAVLQSAVDSVRPAADAKGVALACTIHTAETVVRGDARRLQQVAWNLLSNAVRFTPAGGQVSASLRQVGDEVELRFEDTGCGISPDFLPHVFERFRQEDSSTTRAHGGLGLGLAIVHDIVGLHDGTVQAESEGEGRGATFIVRLPVSCAKNDAAAPPAATGVPRLTGARVLVVDDDPDTRDVLKTVLESAGAEVVLSASAGETRTAFARAHPDLLIADIGMPGEDGYALISSIREMETGTSHVPAIALTARTRPEDVEQALAAGFQLHLAKPIDSGRLVESVVALVNH